MNRMKPVKRAKAQIFRLSPASRAAHETGSLPGADAPGFMLSPASQAEEQLEFYFLCKAI